MESLKELYRIGHGPSSSHTMGPRFAAEVFMARLPEAAGYRVTLYGSLAATGRGHLTDKALESALAPRKTEIVWRPETFLPFHPNGMKFEGLDAAGKVLGEWTVYSVGGGRITDGLAGETRQNVYDLTGMDQALDWTKRTGGVFWEYVVEREGEAIFDHMKKVWETMQATVARGLETEGVLPGGLHLRRKAASFYVKSKSAGGSLMEKTLTFSYALAVAEENAAGGLVVTAPTCGSAAVLPAVLCRLNESLKLAEVNIYRALLTAGLFGNVIKTNASISGAEVGCQGEVGAACAMAAAAAAQLLGGTPQQVEYAAEIGMEHHLGLTCDPICGLVQVPCIERNAFAAASALNSATYALLGDGRHIVSFDKIVKAMKQTGRDLPAIYKETSAGGMAALGL